VKVEILPGIAYLKISFLDDGETRSFRAIGDSKT
jgi:hypothetical protein